MADVTRDREAITPDHAVVPTHRPETPARHAPRGPLFGPARLFELQRMAGNAAVAELIEGQSATPVVVEPQQAPQIGESHAAAAPVPPPPGQPAAAGNGNGTGNGNPSGGTMQRAVGVAPPKKAGHAPAPPHARAGAHGPDAVDAWVEPTTVDAATLAQTGGRVIRGAKALAAIRPLIFIVTSNLSVYDSDGTTLLGQFPLAATVPLPPGVFFSSTNRTARVGQRKGKFVTINVAPDKAVADQFDLEKWAKVPPDKLVEWYKGRGSVGLFFVTGALPTTEKPVPPPADWEYTGGTKVKGPLLPALSAELQGLDKQPIGGTGTYKMAMNWTEAGPALLDWVAEASSPARYRWELYNLSNTEAALRTKKAEELQQSVAVPAEGSAEGRRVGRLEGSKRDFDRTSEDLAKRKAKYSADAAKAASEGRYGDVVANAVSTALYDVGVEPLAAYSKNFINLLGDIWGVGFEQMIGWTQGPGTYMIRCVAQLRPGAPESELRRAATVAVKVVQVMPVEAIAEETLNKGEDDVAAAEKRLADEQKAAAAQHRAPQTGDLTARLQETRTREMGSPTEVIQQRIVKKTTEWSEATERFPWDDPVTGGDNPFVRPIAAELRALYKQLALAQTREKQMVASGAKPEDIIRVRAALASRVDGQTYPLLLQMSLPKKEGDGLFHCLISDVTSKDTGEYEGQGKSELLAAQNAMDILAGHSDYGEGALAARLPKKGPFVGLPEETRTLRSKLEPRDWKVAKKSLNDLATILVLLGLLVPGVGEVAAVLAGALAAERLVERFRNDTFEVDSAAIGDVLSVLAAFATGVNVVGRLNVAKVGTRYVITMAKEGGAVAKAAGQAGRYIGIANTIYADVEAVKELMDIEDDVINGRITATEGRRKRAAAIVSATQAALFTVETVKGEGHRAQGGGERPPGEGETKGGGNEPPLVRDEGKTNEREKTATTEPPKTEPDKGAAVEPKAGTVPGAEPVKRTVLDRAAALGQFQESLRAGAPDSVARAEDLIKAVPDWKGELRSAVKDLPPELQTAAQDALSQARRAIVNRIIAEVQAAHADVRAIDVGTPKFTSDIDLNWKPKEAIPGFEGKPRSEADQFKEAAAASDMFLDKLRSELGGRETDVALDVNSYYFIAESHGPAGERAPGVTKLVTEMSFAEQRRGMSKEAWEQFKAKLLEPLAPKAGEPGGFDSKAMDAENTRIAEKLTAELNAAESRFDALEAEVQETRAQLRKAHPMDSDNVVARKARDQMLKARNEKLAKALSAKPSNPVEIARLQHEIRWLFPDAYVGQPGVDAAVRYSQEFRAMKPSEMGPTWAEAKGRTTEELAQAASGNLAKLFEHMHGSTADQLKAALKYAARILNLVEASGLRAGGDPLVIKALGDFVQSRWEIWSDSEIPSQLVLDWVSQFAETDSEVVRGTDGRVVNVSDNTKGIAIDALTDWANDTSGRLWRIATAQAPPESRGGRGSAKPGGEPPPAPPKRAARSEPAGGDVAAPHEPGKVAMPADAARLADLKTIRIRYLEGIRSLDITENEMRKLGRTSEEIARKLVADRNALKVETRALMKPEEVAQLEARNLETYGDPVGPSPEWLFTRYGSWDKVIEATKRTDPGTNKLLGVE